MNPELFSSSEKDSLSSSSSFPKGMKVAPFAPSLNGTKPASHKKAAITIKAKSKTSQNNGGALGQVFDSFLSFDLITQNQYFYIKNSRSFTTHIGGILTLLLLMFSVLIFWGLGGFESSVTASVEFDLSAEDLDSIDSPDMKIIYGFPKSIFQNLEVQKQVDGAYIVLPLQDYTPVMWGEFFNFSMNSEYVYKFHSWQSTSIIRVVEKTPSQQKTHFPTQFYNYNQTNFSCLIRLNEFGDVECFSTNAINCRCELITAQQVADFIATNQKNFDPLSCGEQHLMLWAMDGYSSASHWCNIQRKVLLNYNPGITFETLIRVFRGD